MPNVKTIELTGSETAVKFGENYPYFWVQNLSDSDVFMAMAPNIVPDADGVMLIPAKSGRSTGDVGQTDTLYLSGSGKVEITPQFNAVCPFFKRSTEGGESNAYMPSLIQYSVVSADGEVLTAPNSYTED